MNVTIVHAHYLVGRLVILGLKRVKASLRYLFGNQIKKQSLCVFSLVTPYELSEQ